MSQLIDLSISMSKNKVDSRGQNLTLQKKQFL